MKELFFKYRENILNKDWLIDMFTKARHVTKEELSSLKDKTKFNTYAGKLLLVGNDVHVITEVSDDFTFVTEFVSKYDTSNQPYLDFHDNVRVTPKEAENLTSPVTSTFGRYILNYMLIISIVGDKIPYINEGFDLSYVEDLMAELYINEEITEKELDKFLNNEFFLSNFSDLVAPSISKAAITVDPKVIELRDKLLEEHKDQLDDPEIMMMIENKLIALDKEILAKDPDKGFLISGKNFTTHRKRMFLTMGILPAFGDEDKDFNFSSSNLDSGWKKEDLPVLFNDVRNGSYSRGKDTAKGGAETKYLGRAFQETSIVEEDCKTKRGLETLLKESAFDKKDPNSLLFRYCYLNGKLMLISEKDKTKLLGKKVILRSPQFCTTKDGYCYKCMDSRFKRLGMKRLNTLAISIGSTFLQNSMKKMHGSSVSSVDVSVNILNEASIQ